MPDPVPTAVTRQLDLVDEAATRALASRLSSQLRQGDVVALSGDLGAGKTAFARAFIQALAEHQNAMIDEVPSPTFTIVQIYDELDPPVWHVDLYRLEDRSDAFELGLDEAYEDGITLIEWPDRLGEAFPADHLRMDFQIGASEGTRSLTLSGHGIWAARLQSLDLGL
jgi:tRNA threonylcarbamoyladenosine biosynthesis protein TsaE